MVLVDCQGTGDTEKSCPEVDTLISYISAGLSSVQIINFQRVITSDDYLKLKVQYNKSVRGVVSSVL